MCKHLTLSYCSILHGKTTTCSVGIDIVVKLNPNLISRVNVDMLDNADADHREIFLSSVRE